MLSLYLSMVGDEEQRSLVEQLFSDYEQIMFRTAYAVLHNEQDAEDAVHEAFVRLIPIIDRFTDIEPSKRRSYIVIMTRNIAIDLCRSERKQVDMNDSEIGDESGDEAQR